MNSINNQQPEDNYEDLWGEKAKMKIRELNEKASSCFFCTDLKAGQPFDARPMSVQQLDDDGIFWFLSAKDSHKNKAVASDPFIQLLFQGSDYSDFLHLYGNATIDDNKEKIKELWNPMLKTWFTEGVDDPRISVIRFEPDGGYYWDTRNNIAIGLLKRVAGAISGKTLDDSIEGTLNV